MLEPSGLSGKNKINFVYTRPMVPYLNFGLLTENRSVGEEKVRKVTLGKNQWFVWVPLGPGEVLSCPPQLAINPKPGPPLHPVLYFGLGFILS